MKRMIDLKEFLQLQALALSTQQLATDNEKRLDDLEDVYTYSSLAIDADDFDCIDTASPESFEPVSLVIGDHVYIDGEQTDLTAEMIADIYDSNLVVLSCGDYPANYPNVILQRQVIDPASGALSPKAARFEAFVTLDSTVYHYTMTVTKYDSTSEEGGSIVLACTEDASKPIYIHPILLVGSDIYVSLFIFNNSAEPIDTWDKLKAVISAFPVPNYARVPCSGSCVVSNVSYSPTLISWAKNTNTFSLFYRGTGSEDMSINLTNKTLTVLDGVNRIN